MWVTASAMVCGDPLLLFLCGLDRRCVEGWMRLYGLYWVQNLIHVDKNECALLQWSRVCGPLTFPSQTGQWSLSFTASFLVLHPLPFLCSVPPPQVCRFASNPLLVKLPKSRIIAHLHLFVPLFFLPVERSSASLSFFLPALQDGCSPPSQIITHPQPWSFYPQLTLPKPISFEGSSFSFLRVCKFV